MERSKELSMDEAFHKTVYDIVCANLNNEKLGLPELARELEMSRLQVHRKLQKIISKSQVNYTIYS